LPKYVLAEDFSILLYGQRRFRRVGDSIVVLH
jgi:hypothetical protein